VPSPLSAQCLLGLSSAARCPTDAVTPTITPFVDDTAKVAGDRRQRGAVAADARRYRDNIVVTAVPA
jgi:hypothetical protein